MLFCTVVAVYRLRVPIWVPVVVVLVVVVRWCRGGWREAIPPLSTPRVGTMKGLGMQKFFFEFWGALVLWVEWG